MFSVSTLVRRAPRTLMFWLVVAILVVAVIRSFHPRGGFDEVRTGANPLAVVATDDGVWVLNHGDLSVSLIDPSDADVQFTTEVGEDVVPALAANDDGAWVLVDGGAAAVRVDPGSGDVTDRIDLTDELESGGQDLAAGDGFVWVTSAEEGKAVQLGPDGHPDVRAEFGHAVAQPQVVGDALWVQVPDGLMEVDATTARPVETVETEHRVHTYVAADDALWLLTDIDGGAQTGLIVRLDPETGDEEARFRIAETRPNQLTVAGDQLFVSGNAGVLVELSTHPLAEIGREQITISSKDLHGLTVAEGTVWVTDGLNGVAHVPVDEIEPSSPDATIPV